MSAQTRKAVAHLISGLPFLVGVVYLWRDKYDRAACYFAMSAAIRAGVE